MSSYQHLCCSESTINSQQFLSVSSPPIPNVADRPELISGKIHVWYACIDRSPKEIKEFAVTLSPEETARAKRFRSDQDRDRYIVQHGVLRALLAGYLGFKARQVDICTSAHGKPYLAGKDATGSVQFSISHSGAYAAFAFGRSNSIGVDIEETRKIPEMDGIVAQHFTPREKAELLVCTEDQRLMLFYRFWTRKEAVLKAQGEGLLKGIDSVDVATGEGSGPWQIGVAGETTMKKFFVMDIKGPEGFSAAVAVAGPIVPTSIQLRFR
jgi:4'-phosphopantetheinyl transferase